MADIWKVVADDSTLTRTGLIERLEVTENPRHRKILETVIEHDRCETVGDLEGVLATLSPNANFYRWGPTGDTGPKGLDAIREHYTNMFARGGTGNFCPQYKRVVVDDDTIVAEYRVTQIVPQKLAKQSGYAVPDEDGHYALHRQIVSLFPFDKDGLMLAEISYGGMPNPQDFERVSDERLSPGYLEWVRQNVPDA